MIERMVSNIYNRIKLQVNNANCMQPMISHFARRATSLYLLDLYVRDPLHPVSNCYLVYTPGQVSEWILSPRE